MARQCSKREAKNRAKVSGSIFPAANIDPTLASV